MCASPFVLLPCVFVRLGVCERVCMCVCVQACMVVQESADMCVSVLICVFLRGSLNVHAIVCFFSVSVLGVGGC